MRRQTYAGPVKWIIVDDGQEPQTVPEVNGWEINIIRPNPCWRPGQNTLVRNVRVGLTHVINREPLLFIEDDEHYAPDYLARMETELQTHELVGQGLCRKYNLATMRAKERLYPSKSSLCATGIRGNATAAFRKIATHGYRFPDMVMWRNGGHILRDATYVTGIKCMPGRPGIDSGHRPDFGDIFDPNGALLKSWIGEDAVDYHQYMHMSKQDRQGEIGLYVKAYQSPEYKMGKRRLADVRQIINKLERGSFLDIGTGRGEALHMARCAGMS